MRVLYPDKLFIWNQTASIHFRRKILTICFLKGIVCREFSRFHPSMHVNVDVLCRESRPQNVHIQASLSTTLEDLSQYYPRFLAGTESISLIELFCMLLLTSELIEWVKNFLTKRINVLRQYSIFFSRFCSSIIAPRYIDWWIGRFETGKNQILPTPGVLWNAFPQTANKKNASTLGKIVS